MKYLNRALPFVLAAALLPAVAAVGQEQNDQIPGSQGNASQRSLVAVGALVNKPDKPGKNNHKPAPAPLLGASIPAFVVGGALLVGLGAWQRRRNRRNEAGEGMMQDNITQTEGRAARERS